MTTEPDADLSHDELAALKHVALAGALDRPVEVTTEELAVSLDVPREAARRCLRRLRDAGHLDSRGDDGCRLRVTRDGRTALAREYVDYHRLFGPAHVPVSDRTHHDASELEVLAPDKPRDELDLRDGDGVTVRVAG